MEQYIINSLPVSLQTRYETVQQILWSNYKMLNTGWNARDSKTIM